MFKLVGPGPYCAVSFDGPTFSDLEFYLNELGHTLLRVDPEKFLESIPDPTLQYINLVSRFPLREKISHFLDTHLLSRFSFFSSYVPKLENIADGVFIYPSVNLYPSAKINQDVLVHSGVTIAHNSVVGKGSYISGHTGLAGNVKLGQYCWLGLDSLITDNIIIADHTTLTVRSLVIKDIVTENTVYSKHVKS